MICADNVLRNANFDSSPCLAQSNVQSSDCRRDVSTDAQIVTKSRPVHYFVRAEDCAWLELSMISEVERVFVFREADRLRIIAVVNDRNPEIRKKIYEREKAIIDINPQEEFDFHILSRSGRDLHEIIDYADKPAYTRRR